MPFSDFRRRLRLPRLFFRKPTEAERIHGGPPFEIERPIPQLSWRWISIAVALVVAAALLIWELHCRSIGYSPSLNDNDDLWSLARRKVKPDSLLLIGDSTGWFDLDLDELEKGLGQRPIQLCAAGAWAFPVLEDLANDQRFHGTIICSFVPQLFFPSPNALATNLGENIVQRFHNQTLTQRFSERVAIVLEEHFAFLKKGELDLGEMLRRLPIPNRPGAHVPPLFPHYLGVLDRERRMRMTEKCADPNSDEAKQIQQIALRLFMPPRRPSDLTHDEWVAKMRQVLAARFSDTMEAVEKLQARGAKIVFVRFPVSGELKSIEVRFLLRSTRWEPLLHMTRAPGIYYSDFPDLSGFNCPDWAHLSAGDSVEFSKRLVPHLREALKM